MQNEMEKLSIKEKVGYSVGDTASNLYFQVFILFLMYFYTDVFGLTPKDIAFMFLITRIWDAVNDPLMGILADRTNTRWGKFRPYLLWCAVPFGIFGVLMFTTPDLGYESKRIYAYITYTLMMMIYTAINVPYSALMGVITPNSMDRTTVSSFRFVGAFVGVFIIQYGILKLVGVFGQESETTGWQYAMAVMSTLAVILFLITFATTKERVHQTKEDNNALTEDLLDLIRNIPWLLIGTATIFQLMFNVIRGGSIMYYFEYFIQNQDVVLFGKTYNCTFNDLASAFMLSGTAFTIIGAVVTKWFSNALGKGRTYVVFLVIGGISAAGIYWVDRQNLTMLFILQLISSFSIGPVSVLQWTIYTDTADYSEWKTGRRATALIMSASLFALKLGVALGGAVLAWVLAGYGYEANQQQTERSLQGIRLALTIYPAIFAIIGAAIMVFYPITKKKILEIETDLIERRRQYKIKTSETKGE